MAISNDFNSRAELSLALEKVIAAKDISLLRLLVAAGADANRPDSKGIYPIDNALASHWWEGAEMLVAGGAAVPHLTEMVAMGDPAVVEYLINVGYDPDAADETGKKPVDVALEFNLYDMAQKLVDLGAKPPALPGTIKANGHWEHLSKYIPDTADLAKYERETTLTYLVKEAGHYNIILTALLNGADVNKKNKQGETPLQAAVERPWQYLAVELMRRGAWIDPKKKDPNEIIDETTGATRLLAAVMEGKDLNLVRRILAEGADPNMADNFGLTPYALANAMGWKEAATSIYKWGGSKRTPFPDANQIIPGPNEWQPEKGAKSLLAYALNGQHCHTAYIKALVTAGADIDARDSNGFTPLHHAAHAKNNQRVYMLVEAGADIYAAVAKSGERKDHDGMTPMLYAAMHNNTWLLRYLASKDPDLLFAANEKTGMTPLALACLNGHDDLAALVLSARRTRRDMAMVNESIGKNENTLLNLALSYARSEELVARLLRAGALVDMPDADGETPLLKAIDHVNPAIVRLLLDAGADLAKSSERAKYNPPFFHIVNKGWDDAKKKEDSGVVARMMLEAGADPNIVATESINGPQKGDSLLYFAVSYHNLPVAEAILEGGADVHATSHIGASAMDYCLDLRSISGVELLLKHGFDVEKTFEYTEHWSGGGEGARDVHFKWSALEHARHNAEKFKDRGLNEHDKMLEMIEAHLAAKKAAPAAVAETVAEVAEAAEDPNAAYIKVIMDKLGKKPRASRAKKPPAAPSV